MYDFLEKNAMYIVLLIALIIWIGLFFYMFRLDKRIKKLEKEKNTE
ncbi:MAG: CcmD family protein [Ignavibacteriae bacterium]|nr:CcmD family protein [Ignavibacteriota bacterium]